MDKPFIAENARELKRLRSIVQRLSHDELSLPLGTDWTISVPWLISPFGTTGLWS